MSKRKNFKDLFGGDDSDEENEQTEFSATSTIRKEQNHSKNAHNNDKYSVQALPDVNKKSVQRNKYRNTECIEKQHNSQEEEIQITTLNQIKKKVKTQHENNKFQSIFDDTSTDKTEDINDKNSLSHTKHQNDNGKEKVKLKKTEIGGLVVKLLTPAYVEKRFDSRDTFKMLARNISHALYDKGK